MATTFTTLKQRIESDKVRERQEGLRNLQEMIQRDSFLIDVSGRKRGWTTLYQVLFDAFATEYKACVKAAKHNPSQAFTANTAAVRRVCDVASTLRRVIERSGHLINETALHCLIVHLTKHCQYRGTLLPVALDYAKSLKFLLSWKPHVEQLSSDAWHLIVKLSFNAVLGDELSTPLTSTDNAVTADVRGDTPNTPTTSSDQASGDDDDDSMMGTSIGGKRRRSEKRADMRHVTESGSYNTVEKQNTPISLEQIEFISIIAILLESRYSPLVENVEKGMRDYRPAVMERMTRFLYRFQPDSSLHHEYLRALRGVLENIALNERALTLNFARDAWPGLLRQWGSKNQSVKEQLIIVLKVLFPYLIAGQDEGSHAVQVKLYDNLSALWQQLRRESDKRGVEGLLLDSLRLSIVPPDGTDARPGPFVAHTFRHGWHFDASQAMSWAIFELQADCAEKLYLLSESMHASSIDENIGKRRKRVNPVEELLDFISHHTADNVRGYYLQSLLFFIDRHWSVLHTGLRKVIADRLQTALSMEDSLTQSWTFMCLGAIAHADATDLSVPDHSLTPSQLSSVERHIPWDYIWQQVMRRTSAVSISRTACHAANILLSHSKILLNPHKVLVEVEMMTKDLTIQGPSYPYDSVCALLISCMQVAGHDVRLYRLQLEDKVLTWFMDTWRAGGIIRSRLSCYIVEDLLSLLRMVCTLPRRADVLSTMQLPKSIVVDALVTEYDTAVIRDFLLHARLPPHHDSRASCPPGELNPQGTQDAILPRGDSLPLRELAVPRTRERRISSYLLKSLEELTDYWEANKDNSLQFPAERVRTYLDLSIITFCFEGSLIQNGTQSNRRVVQAACKLLVLVVSSLASQRWTETEKGVIVAALEPLILGRPPEPRFSPWDTLLEPGPGTGIRFEMLHAVRQSNHKAEVRRKTSLRRELQCAIMQSSDAQDAFTSVLKYLRVVLRESLNRNGYGDDIDVDVDGFEQAGPSSFFDPLIDESIATSDSRLCVDVCISALSSLPAIQSASGEATRDKELIQILEGCPGHILPLVFPATLCQVRFNTLSIKPGSIIEILDTIRVLRRTNSYFYGRSEAMQYLVIEVLDATMHLWLHPTTDAELRKAVAKALNQLKEDCIDEEETDEENINGKINEQRIKSWRCRDRFVQFFDHYFQRDRLHDAWSWSIIQSMLEGFLYRMLGDVDIRVRFRAAAVVPRLFTIEGFARREPLELYDEIRRKLTNALDEYENMLTRLITLGNMMIVSSAVRRGTYWHFLETCLLTPEFNQHMTVVLEGLATRFGFSSFSQLFEVYASQLAYSIRSNNYDILRIPPHLIGYQDRRQGAEACFHTFTPANILTSTPHARSHGRNLFERHCHFVSKTTTQGIRECFADVVGYQIVTWVSIRLDMGGDLEAGKLMEQLRMTAAELDSDGVGENDTFLACLTEHVDGIIAVVLRTLHDQDFGPNGSIVAALQTNKDPHVVEYFLSMSKYRKATDFQTHAPNSPVFATEAVLTALAWINTHIPQVGLSATTYHVLHQLFAELNRSPLINEQVRFYNAITLWLSLNRKHIFSPDVLRTLINGASITLSQSDNARCAQSLLEWVFSLLGPSSMDLGAHLAETLIRISCTAYDYTLHNDTRIVSLGHELMDWVEMQSASLCQRKFLRRQVLKALSTWPRELPDYLQDIWESNDHPDVSKLLCDQRVISNKFRVVRRLQQLSSQDMYLDRQFSTTDFWRLKECVPASGQLLDSDVDAFCELLVLHKGHVNGLVNDTISSNSVRARHIYEADAVKKSKDIADAFGAAQKAIILSLIDILDESSITRVHNAYVTLKELASQATGSVGNLEELEIFKPFPRDIPTRPQPAMTSLLTNDIYSELTSDFKKWIVSISVFLNDILGSVEPSFLSLSLMLQSDAPFAEQVVPVLVYCVLLLERSSRVIPSTISAAETLSKYFLNTLAAEFTNIECRRTIVDVVLHLRHFMPPDIPEALGYDKWLNIDYIVLGNNALLCGSFTTALLFIQLAAEYSTTFSLETEEVEKILHEIYRHIDEPDGFYGIKSNNLSSFLIKRLQHEQRWEKAFQFHGAGLEAGVSGTADIEGAVLALHNFGFNNLAIQTLHGPLGSEDGLPSSSMAYRLGWRTETWDLPETTRLREPGVALYVALRAVERERDGRAIDAVVRNALREEMDHLRDLGNEDVQGIRQVTQSLMCLNQISRWRGKKFQDDLTAQDISREHWTQFSRVDTNFEFSDLESILAVRRSLYRLTSRRELREQIGDTATPFYTALQNLETACLLRLSEAARQHEQTQIALNAITAAQRLRSSLQFEVAQEFAHVLWLTKEPKYAVQHLRTVVAGISNGHDTSDQKLRNALLLTTLGTWTSEACLEKPAFVMSQYFLPAVDMLDSYPDTKDSATAYYQFALFADRQYHTMMKSPDALRMRLYVDRKRKEVEERKKTLNSYQSVDSKYHNAERALERAAKVLEEDEYRFDEHIQAQVTFLKQAVAMYSRSLAISDGFDDDSAVRLCSLWFANFDFDKGEFQSQLATAVAQVPSRKLVFLAHQLTARLVKPDSSSRPPGQDILQPLVKRMCREHPFHSLYQVFCLQSDRPSSDQRQSGQQTSSTSPSTSQIDRAAAATSIFDQLLSDGASRSRVKDIKTICEASLAFANYPLKNKRKTLPSTLNIPSQLRAIENLRVPVMTIDIPLDPTSRYNNCVWVQKYERQFSTAGGLNLPKIAVCIGSDGKSYKQLFKGEGGDDLRQDAVMEQVFDLVNVMLKRDKATRRRHLHVRSYKVIPLASQAGVLEFVDHTTPLMKWLAQAHTQYHPSEISKSRWSELDSLRLKGDLAGMKKLFRKFWDNVQPVMRHYFTERHKTPMSWFRLRLNYARSVATTSIVGHILGLGDRHTSNILLDNHTGEVVHIDLGIAFDQGKLLPVPEKVPFRLTRDMVDGLGVTGTQGVFQRCSEETLRVLRDRSEVITTVLEVFKHDPLHSWTANELKVKRAQTGETFADLTAGEAIRQVIGVELLDMSSGIAHEAADRAITSVIRKLDKTLTVEFTVNELISEATDKDNLAEMYYGWGALW